MLVIEKVLALPGFPENIQGKFIMVGFGHKTLLSIADQIITAVKKRRFVTFS